MFLEGKKMPKRILKVGWEKKLEQQQSASNYHHHYRCKWINFILKVFRTILFIYSNEMYTFVYSRSLSLSLFPLLCLSYGSRRSHFLISIRLKHSTLVSTIRRKPRWNIHHVEIVFMVALTILHWTCAGKLIFLTSFSLSLSLCYRVLLFSL